MLALFYPGTSFEITSSSFVCVVNRGRTVTFLRAYSALLCVVRQRNVLAVYCQFTTPRIHHFSNDLQVSCALGFHISVSNSGTDLHTRDSLASAHLCNTRFSIG
jgi:hypothetical protein